MKSLRNISFWICFLILLCFPLGTSATPTQSPAVTPTASASATPTASPTATPTATPTPTPDPCKEVKVGGACKCHVVKKTDGTTGRECNKKKAKKCKRGQSCKFYSVTRKDGRVVTFCRCRGRKRLAPPITLTDGSVVDSIEEVDGQIEGYTTTTGETVWLEHTDDETHPDSDVAAALLAHAELYGIDLDGCDVSDADLTE